MQPAVCVDRDNVSVNHADACDGVYVADPPSCTWNSTNQSLVIAANVTVRCDQPSNSGYKGSCRLAFDFAHGITVESGAHVSGGCVHLSSSAARIVVERGARVEDRTYAEGRVGQGLWPQWFIRGVRVTGVQWC